MYTIRNTNKLSTRRLHLSYVQFIEKLNSVQCSLLQILIYLILVQDRPVDALIIIVISMDIIRNFLDFMYNMG